MSSGFLDLAYMIEISIVFNLAYREIKHGSVLNKMKEIREKMNKDEELQSRLKIIKTDYTIAGKTVKKNYQKLMSIIECDKSKIADCSKKDSILCSIWSHEKHKCRYFVGTVLTGNGLKLVESSIIIALFILIFATFFPHIGFTFAGYLYSYVWWFLFTALLGTIIIPVYFLYMSKIIEDILAGKNGKDGLIAELEKNFITTDNEYLAEKAKEKKYT